MTQLSPWGSVKRCTRCGETKPIETFRLRTSQGSAPYRTSRCIACLNRASAERYAADRERRLAYHKARLEVGGEAINARRRVLRTEDPEKYRVRERRYYYANRESRKIKGRRWAQANRERVNASQRRARAANPERVREKGRRDRIKYRETFRENVRRRRAIKRAATIGPVTVALLRAKWKFWGGLCYLCGDDAVEWDHVKPLAKGGAHCLSNLRPACRSCNARKCDAWPLAA